MRTNRNSSHSYDGMHIFVHPFFAMKRFLRILPAIYGPLPLCYIFVAFNGAAFLDLQNKNKKRRMQYSIFLDNDDWCANAKVVIDDPGVS